MNNFFFWHFFKKG